MRKSTQIKSDLLHFTKSKIYTGLKTLSVAALAGSLLAVPGISQAVTINSLGTLGGQITKTNGISGDGSTVIGESQGSNNYSTAFAWTEDSGMTNLGTLGGNGSYASSASTDGSVVVGASQTSTGTKYKAFIWTAENGMENLGTLGGDRSYAKDVSGDGSVAVGYSRNSNSKDTAFVWTSESGMTSLGTLGGTKSYANAISQDSSTIVGYSQNSDSNYEAYIATLSEESGDYEMTGIGFLGETTLYSSASDVSADGSVAVGISANSDSDYEAFIWTEDDGMTGLGLLGGVQSGANAVSADGSTVVGYYLDSDYGKHAFIWTEETGTVSLWDLLTDEGIDLSDWSTLGYAMGVSDDGSIITGYGYNSDNQTTSWVIDLNASPVPVPGALWLLGSGLVGLMGLRRRKK